MSYVKRTRRGFTLIELMIVIAILAFVTVVGIHSYGNIKEIQAKKVNLANLKRTFHSLVTYEELCKEQGVSAYFAGFDSLIDAESGGKWLGAAGTFSWGESYTSSNVYDDQGRQQFDANGNPLTSVTEDSFSSRDSRTVHNGFGIYDGSWKVLMATYNAQGEGAGSVPGLEAAREANKGTRETGLYKHLGIYYLTSSDVSLLKAAGVSYYFLHNPSTAQAYGSSRGGYCSAVVNENGINLSQDGLKIMGGGPGHRPDMSAFYPVYLTEGSPVAVIQPGSTIYDDLGYSLAYTNATFQASTASQALSSTKLICFGIGKNANCVRNQFGLGEAPYNPYYDKRNYRQYVAVFVLKAGGQGVVSACRLAGVIDCAGNTYRAAEYGLNWSTALGN